MSRRVALVIVVLASAVPVVAQAAGTPTVSTGSATGIGDTKATVSGSVDPNGAATTYSFQYGTTTAYGQQTSTTSAGSGSSSQSESVTLSGLRPGTTYHFRIVATNASGTAAGSDATFKTTGTAPVPAPAPTVKTGSATDTSRNGATLNGTVVPLASATTYYFEYGTSSIYGTRTTPKQLAAGTIVQSVSATLDGLQANRTYHFRLVATNDGGTTPGDDQTFTTGAARPTPTRVTARTTPARDRTSPYRFTTRGTVVRPADVSSADGCTGRVAVRVKKGSKTVSSRRAVVRRDCTYRSTVTFTNRSGVRGRRLKVTVQFLGNDTLGSKSGPTRYVRAG